MKIRERNKMTFPQLWRTLTMEEATELRKEIKAGLKKTSATFWRWYKGQTVPESHAEKALFTEITNRTLGMNTNADTLFPQNK